MPEEAALKQPAHGPLALEPVSSFAELGVAAAQLAEASGSVYATPEWLATWWEHFGNGRRHLVTAARDETGQLVGLLPLYLWSARPLRVLRLAGYPASGRLGPICAESDRARLARALWDLLAGLKFDVFVAENLYGGDSWPTFLGRTSRRRTPSPILRLAWPSWEAFLAGQSSNLRQELRRKEKRLQHEHALRYRLATDPEQLDADLDTLFELHTGRWDRQTPFSQAAGFHRAFARLALEQGWLRLWFMELDGKAAAAWYGFRYAGTEFYYQAGRDPAWETRSVGLVLLAHTIREAMTDGVHLYDFGHGGGPYKYRFASEDPGKDVVVVAGSAAGRGAELAVRVGRALPPVKRALQRTLQA